MDAEEEARILAKVRRGLVLHGHLHRRIQRKLSTDRGHMDSVGATSASLLHPSDERMAGFNIYEIESDGAVREVVSHRLDERHAEFREVAVPVG
jgi:hypothetical protein